MDILGDTSVSKDIYSLVWTLFVNRSCYPKELPLLIFPPFFTYHPFSLVIPTASNTQLMYGRLHPHISLANGFSSSQNLRQDFIGDLLQPVRLSVYFDFGRCLNTAGAPRHRESFRELSMVAPILIPRSRPIG